MAPLQAHQTFACTPAAVEVGREVDLSMYRNIGIMAHIDAGKVRPNGAARAGRWVAWAAMQAPPTTAHLGVVGRGGHHQGRCQRVRDGHRCDRAGQLTHTCAQGF